MNIVLESLEAKAAKQIDVLMGKRSRWVDKDKFIGMKVEFYAKSRKLLKVLTVEDIKSFKNRYYPTKVMMEDKLRKNSKTEMIIKSIEFDILIPRGTFTERNLMRR